MSRYTIFAARAVFDPSLSANDKVVLAALGSYTNGEGWCYPSQKTLCERLGIARSTLCAALKKLVDKGYVAARARTSKGRGKVGNEYRVLVDLPPMSAQPDIGSQVLEIAPMSDRKDIGKKPMSRQPDIGPQSIEITPMSAPPDNGADVHPAGHPMSAQPDIGIYNALTSPMNEPSKTLVPRQAGNEVAPGHDLKARKPKTPKPYSKDFEMIWLAWPKNRRANSDKRKAFERYETGVANFGAEAVSAAARRYLSLPETRKDQWKYCRLVEVFMNGGLEAAVEAAREDARVVNGAELHEADRDRAAKAWFKKTGKWPPGYKPPLEPTL